MPEPLLALAGVHTHIGHYHILQGVDLAVRRGAWTVLLGRNGAGKTTTLRTIMGMWPASGGSVVLDGTDITRLGTPRIARRGVGYVPEDMGIFGGLSVAENLQLAVRSGRMDAVRLARVYELFPVLRKLRDTLAGVLSGGQKQMLSIARVLLEPKQLILVDEPTKGLAPAVVQDLATAFRELKQGPTSVLLVEQNFHFAQALGDDVAVMDNGRIVHAGSMAALAGDAGLQRRLLGFDLGNTQ